MRKIITLVFLVLIYGCATTKGYVGETLPDSELAIIYAPKNKAFSTKRPAGSIARVGGIEVGSYGKGYPGLVKVQPGIVEVQLNLTWPSLMRGLAIGLGGAVGGAVGGSAGQGHKVFKIEVERGKTYIIEYDLIEGKRDISPRVVEYVPEIKEDVEDDY